MTFPYVSAITAGVLLILQILLALTVSMGRNDTAPLGDGGSASMQRTVRRHGNLAENAGLFVAGFTLLELSRLSPYLLAGLCMAFVVVRLAHVLGLSQENTMNPFRMVGGVGTYLVGLILGAALVWAGLSLPH